MFGISLSTQDMARMALKDPTQDWVQGIFEAAQIAARNAPGRHIYARTPLGDPKVNEKTFKALEQIARSEDYDRDADGVEFVDSFDFRGDDDAANVIWLAAFPQTRTRLCGEAADDYDIEGRHFGEIIAAARRSEARRIFRAVDRELESHSRLIEERTEVDGDDFIEGI